MSTSKIVTVFGATGAQGGSVLKALVKDKRFKVRAITRNKESEKAKQLLKLGCEICEADLNDKDSLRKAMHGAYGVFLVTNYWEIFDVEREFLQGKNAIDVAKDCGVKHVVFSGLENVKALCGFSVPHFDGKGRIDEYLRSSGMRFTTVRLCFYMENLLTFFLPQKEADDTFTLAIPMGDIPLPMVSVAEIGGVITAILNNPDDTFDKTIAVGSDKITIDEMAGILSECLGAKVINSKITVEAYKKLDFPGAEDLGDMFRYNREGNPVRNFTFCRKWCPGMSDFRSWAKANKDALLTAMNA